jgi:hypothetical protein
MSLDQVDLIQKQSFRQFWKSTDFTSHLKRTVKRNHQHLNHSFPLCSMHCESVITISIWLQVWAVPRTERLPEPRCEPEPWALPVCPIRRAERGQVGEDGLCGQRSQANSHRHQEEHRLFFSKLLIVLCETRVFRIDLCSFDITRLSLFVFLLQIDEEIYWADILENSKFLTVLIKKTVVFYGCDDGSSWNCASRPRQAHRLKMWRQENSLRAWTGRGEISAIRLVLTGFDFFRKPRASPQKNRTVRPKDAFEDTAFEPGFEIVKS